MTTQFADVEMPAWTFGIWAEALGTAGEGCRGCLAVARKAPSSVTNLTNGAVNLGFTTDGGPNERRAHDLHQGATNADLASDGAESMPNGSSTG